MNALDIHLRIQTPRSVRFTPSPSETASDTGPGLKLGPARTAVGLSVGMLLAFIILLFSNDLQDIVYRAVPAVYSDSAGSPPASEVEISNAAIAARVGHLRASLTSYVPSSAYLVVSTSDNHFELVSRGKELRSGICSTGSYVLLRGSHDREWMFETPRGAFRILDKRKDPVWTKPDWAFIEEGLPIPPPGSPDRYERGVLGDYALAIGNGYLIHGTLYQRLLGMPVTHGCVRLGDDDLEAVFRELALGSRVFIY